MWLKNFRNNTYWIELYFLFIPPYCHFWPFGFLFFRLYGQKFGRPVFYLFGRLDSSVCTSPKNFVPSVDMATAKTMHCQELVFTLLGVNEVVGLWGLWVWMLFSRARCKQVYFLSHFWTYIVGSRGASQLGGTF